jgi:esterase/lipase superfamily enzyme
LPPEPSASAPAIPEEQPELSDSETPQMTDDGEGAESAAAPQADVPLAPEATSQPGEAAPAGPARQFRFEMRAEEGEASAAPEPRSSAAVEAQPSSAKPTPSSVNVHYATNRNRLTPKERQWTVYFLGFFTSLPAFVIYGLIVLAQLVLPWFGKRTWAATGALVGVGLLCSMGLLEAYVRSQLRDEMTGELYGCRPTETSYGVCTISVPPPTNRRIGELNRPLSVWVFEAPENPDKHFMLRHVEEHKDKADFYRSLSAQLAKSESEAALLFVHGYNVSFEDAIFRTAQLAVDLKFPGAPIAFCWPSYADPVKYTFDEQHAEVSIPALREVLVDLAERSGAKSVHIIAHSMGNRVLAGALRSMDPAAQQRNKEVFRELVLAAPDIDSRVFQSQVLPHIVGNTQHCTLYASSRDRALLISRFFHNYQRLGETEPDLLIASGLDTIDASLVDTSLLGHSYIGDVASIVSDLHDLVVSGKPPTERGLVSSERNALTYWSIKPTVQTTADTPLRR